jgi:hypothetical protein
MRAITSSELAGEAGTMIRTVWLGHCCACAPGVSNAMMVSARNRFTEGPFVGGRGVDESNARQRFGVVVFHYQEKLWLFGNVQT